jgi:hypothetical protein
MAFDIYGERLARGHCEVHPWVPDEYPCYVCGLESRTRLEARARQIDEERAAMSQEHIESGYEDADPGAF